MSRIDYDSLTPEEMQEAIAEIQRRQKAARAEQQRATLAEQINELIFEYRLLNIDGENLQWKRPLSALDSYPLGAVAFHRDAWWESMKVANICEPGVDGWQKVTDSEDPDDEEYDDEYEVGP